MRRLHGRAATVASPNWPDASARKWGSQSVVYVPNGRMALCNEKQFWRFLVNCFKSIEIRSWEGRMPG